MSEVDKIVYKDLPKISLAPKPNEPAIWTVYTDGNIMRARLHEPGKFERFWYDGAINNPENFVDVVNRWVAR